MNALHTPTPWFDDGRGAIYVPDPDNDLGGIVVANVKAADATFIVRACNAHDDLVAAARKTLEWFDRESDHAVSFADRVQLCGDAETMLRAALAKAGAA
jgi:hypothetical protein